MLVLHPQLVKFGAVKLENVAAFAISRVAVRPVLESTDDGGGGPYAVFADVPEQRVTAVVRQTLTREDLTDVRPGDSATLVVYTAPAGSDGSRRKISVTAVVIDAVAELKAGATPGASRVVTFALVSSSGSGDPVTVADAKGEA